MQGRRGLVMGVANDRSIAWGIAQAVAAQGGQLAFTYQGEALERRVRPLAEGIGSSIVLPCDVTDDASVDAVFEAIRREWGGSTSSSTPSASPTSSTCGAATSTRRGRPSCRRWTSRYSFVSVGARGGR
jgi:enoyl-[acyl-carrier protein] reductase I